MKIGENMKKTSLLFAFVLMASTAVAQDAVNYDDPEMQKPTLNTVATAAALDIPNAPVTGEESGRACCGVEGYASSVARDFDTSAGGSGSTGLRPGGTSN